VANFWENILGGGTSAVGAYDLYNRLDKEKGEIGNIIGGIQDTVGKMGSFQPWTISGGVGNVAGGPDGMKFGLAPHMKAYEQDMLGGGRNLLNRSMMNPMQREQQLYDRMREIQAPGERQNLQNMQQRMMSQGRMGMGSTEYGGSPEQMAYYKAMGQAQNEAMMGAMSQAQAEQLQQYNMGMGMSQEGFRPLDYLYKQAGLGQNKASLFAQLGLGGLSSRLNYSNLQTKALGDLYGAGSQFMGGLGAGVDNSGGWGGFWDMLTGGGSDGTQKFLESIGIG
jgi:hypothetical protein